ncbi:hypothetical protein TSAR_010004 [Trichomalopsis sarcophagae]|uniref:Uncharacterized protein n=1 Tax=Trichomalopsis sarcophagae TaxID=543379 RepID=A0A232ELC7_9HYME|nr:hypothetical protein TSAR_010004 [Trichomalopsis sarcophagae]
MQHLFSMKFGASFFDQANNMIIKSFLLHVIYYYLLYNYTYTFCYPKEAKAQVFGMTYRV